VIGFVVEPVELVGTGGAARGRSDQQIKRPQKRSERVRSRESLDSGSIFTRTAIAKLHGA
jgi:hypothetical protein